MKPEVPASVQSLFIKAGWRPSRTVPLLLSEFREVPIFPSAERVISEFGGLRIFPSSHTGEECACSDVHFDPRLSAHETEAAEEWEPRIGHRIFPIGEADKGYLMLFVDEPGRIFEIDIVNGDFCLIGETFAQAMETLLLGRHMRPLLPTGAAGVTFYGEWLPATDPRIYHPA